MGSQGTPTLTFYRVVVAVLFALVMGLLISVRAAHEAHDAAFAGELQPSAGITTIDLRPLVAQFDGVAAEVPDTMRWLVRDRFGSVGLKSFSYQQLMPLHLHRYTDELIVPLAGTLEVQSVPSAPTWAALEAGTALEWTPYSAHALRNPSPAHVAVALKLMTEVDDGPTYLEENDARLSLGSAPARFDAQKELAELLASHEPARFRWLPLLQERLASLTVSTEGQLGPFATPATAVVLRGSGRLAGAHEAALHEGSLLLIDKDQTARLTATANQPLALLLYQPGRFSRSEILANGRKRYSQDDEELVIRDFFGDRRDGVFLDVGCGNYKKHSTTFYLEEQLGWSGLGIDARAELAADYARYRPRTKFVNALVTDKARGAQPFYRAEKFPEVSATDRRVAQDQVQRFEGDDAVTEVQVATATLDEVLDGAGVRSIDLLSMDIEEHEPEALAGFDIERFGPKLVCIEAHRVVRDALMRYFKAHGYHRIDRYMSWDSANWYFTR